MPILFSKAAKPAKVEKFTASYAGVTDAEKVLAEVGQRVRTASARVDALTTRLADAALDGNDYDSLERDLEAAQRDLRRHTAAKTAAEQRLQDAKRQHLAVVHANAVSTIKRHGTKRAAAAGALSAATAEVVKQWKVLVEASAAAGAAYPGTGAPMGGATGPTTLAAWVAAEIFRLGGGRGPTMFPGARCPDLRMLDQPEALPTLVEQIEQANSYLSASLSQPAGDPPTATANNPIEEWTAPGAPVAPEGAAPIVSAEALMASLPKIKLA